MIVLGLDPGTEQSALVAWDGDAVLVHELLDNEAMLERLRTTDASAPAILVIEKIESYGMAVGESTFTTVFWSGRFAQVWTPRRFEQMGRRIVKNYLCNSARAKDANVRQAILDRFGGDKAIGRKATPGPLYGLKGHEFAAFAVALTWFDLNAKQPTSALTGSQGMF